MNISFFLTQDQIRNGTKDVTRRNRWVRPDGTLRVKAGDILQGVNKGQGLKPGEKQIILGKLRVKDARREPLDRMINEPEYGKSEVVREGFPHLTPEQFVEMYCEHNNCKPYELITRIEFEKL